jgi:hypothetical protein
MRYITSISSQVFVAARPRDPPTRDPRPATRGGARNPPTILYTLLLNILEASNGDIMEYGI